MKKLLRNSRYKTVLDIGRGKAFLLEILAEMFARMKFYGYDVSKHIIKENRKTKLENMEFGVVIVNSIKIPDIIVFGSHIFEKNKVFQDLKEAKLLCR